MVNAKTPNKKRKSVGNVDGVPNDALSPKAPNLNSSVKTPGKKGNATPGKFNKTPKAAKGGQNQSPAKNQGQASAKSNKRSNNSATDDASPKKLKKFGGTSELQQTPGKKQVKNENVKQENKKQSGGEQKVKRKGQFFHIKEKVQAGDKSALEELDAKLKAFEGRKELTKTAKRKIKILQKLRSTLTGEKLETKAAPAATSSQKKRERKKEAKNKRQATESGASKQTIPTEEDLVSDDEDSDPSVSKHQVKAEDFDTVVEGDSDDSEEGDEEEDEDSEEEDEDSAEEDDDSEEELPVQIPQGGKKKGQDKKNEVKAKNLKLQAMRKQGQLAGSVKENQKRSARRAKKNAKPVNGSH